MDVHRSSWNVGIREEVASISQDCLCVLMHCKAAREAAGREQNTKVKKMAAALQSEKTCGGRQMELRSHRWGHM